MKRLLALSLLAGCGGASVNASASVSVHDDLAVAPTALAACAKGDINASMQIVSDLRDSYHEMIVCGGLALQFSNSIQSVITNVILQKAMGNGLQYQGNGVYATPNGVMWMRVSLGTSPIGFDVLDPQSYLVGLTVTANANGVVNGAMAPGGGSPWKMLGHAAAKADVQVTFQNEGPGFQLLGITSQEARSGKFDLQKIEHSIASLIHVENRVAVNNEHGGTNIQYILQSPPTPVADMTGPKKVPMTLESIKATNGATGQTVKITKWTMDYKGDGGKVLDGTIGMDIDGGAFPYHVEMTYPHRMEPDITLSCR